MTYATKRLGKSPAALDPRAPRLRDVLTGAYVWADADWRADVDSRIMGDNDQCGDCVVVAAANGTLVQSSYAGHAARMTDDEALANYIAATGYNAANGANDTGLVEQDYLRRWHLTGITIAGKTNLLAGYAHIDPLDRSALRQGIHLGAGVLAGLRLPMSAQSQISAGQPWDVASGPDGQPGTWGGHAVWVLAADQEGVWCVTWAQLQRITWAAWQAWADESWACIDPLFLNSMGVNPGDVGLQAIQAALAGWTS